MDLGSPSVGVSSPSSPVHQFTKLRKRRLLTMRGFPAPYTTQVLRVPGPCRDPFAGGVMIIGERGADTCEI